MHTYIDPTQPFREIRSEPERSDLGERHTEREREREDEGFELSRAVAYLSRRRGGAEPAR